MIGISLQLFDNTTEQASLSDIQALWWDVTEPKDAYKPIGRSDSVTTDASGYIKLDLSNVSGLSENDYGFLMLYQLDDSDHEDSLVFSGKVQVSDITAGGVDMYYYDSGWTRPADWPALDDPVNGVQKIQLLYAVKDIETAGNAVAFSCAGAYTVDWGDGSSSENFTTSVTAEHEYDFADTDLSAVTSKGYKCAIVTITPQTANNITAFNLQKLHSNFSQACTVPWLDIVINSEYLTSLTISQATQVIRTSDIEQVIINEHAVTSMSSMFYACYFLQSVPLFDTSAVTSMGSMFRDCYSLQSVPLFDTSAVTTMSYMFYACYSLQSVPLFDTSAVTSMSHMFRYCQSLQSVPLFDTSAVTTMSYMFYICYSLQSVPLFDTSAVTTMSYMLRSCQSLQSVPLFDTSAVTNMSYMFGYCYSLQSVPLFDTSAVTNMSYMFSYCYSLQSAALDGTNISIDFSNCNLGPEALDEIYTNLATATATITVTGNWGTASDDPSIATAKGWTVTG